MDFFCQLMHKTFALKGVLKFTLKQLCEKITSSGYEKHPKNDLEYMYEVIRYSIE